jgi:hypothetical protein
MADIGERQGRAVTIADAMTGFPLRREKGRKS